MKQSGKCPKCGSKNVLADVDVRDRTRHGATEMTVSIDRSPDALLFKETVESTVSAWICAACGFTELYTDTPKLLTF